MKTKNRSLNYSLILMGFVLILTISCKKKDDNLPTVYVPVLTTNDLSSKTQATGISGGNITSDGGAAVTARGICWNTSHDPTISNSYSNDGTGTGSFISNLSGLNANTIYYARAYATNSAGTGYGNEITFKTYTGTVTDTDGNVYYTVTIGAQIWMAENLKTTKFNDGATIPIVTDALAWSSLTTPGYCWYNNDLTTYGSIYGSLYNFYVVNTGKLAPTGWHVPNQADWTTLVNYLGGETPAGGKLKETGTTHWMSPNDQATNVTDFTALPGGNRTVSGDFTNIFLYGYWWDTNDTFYMMFYNGSAAAWGGFGDYKRGFSVRCIKESTF